MSGLELVGITKRFGTVTAVDGITLSVADGTFVCLLGPSGCGKTTLLRMIAGLEDPTAGDIRLQDERLNDTPAHQRNLGMVFQSLALFPHMSVGHNIEFPLKLRKVPAEKRKARALELLDLLRLPRDYYDKRISQCSGGERQRVALARALAFDPEILFFDEPLSALDYRLRKTLEKELKDLHHRTGKTFVYITHSLEEAMVMSDRIAIMKDGRFEQIAVADEIYSRPYSRFVAEFMGEVNLFNVTAAQGSLSGQGLTVGPEVKQTDLPEGEKGLLMVRPEYVRFGGDGDSFDYTVSGRLLEEYALGSRIQYEIEVAGGQIITVEKLREDRATAKIGTEVTLGFDAANTHLIVEH